MNANVDPRRQDKVNRYKPPQNQGQGNAGEDLMPDYMNILGMVFSMCGLMMKLKWCAWLALYCSCISFANSRVNDDAKQVSCREINLLRKRKLLSCIFYRCCLHSC